MNITYKQWFLTIALTTLSIIAATAQQKVWYAGKVLLTDSTIVEGDINYNLVHQTIRVKSGDKERAYNISMINGFQLYDENKKLLHDFYVLPLDLKEEEEVVPSILEVLYVAESGIALVAQHYLLSEQEKYTTGGLNPNESRIWAPTNANSSAPRIQKFNEQKHSFCSNCAKYYTKLYLIDEEGGFSLWTRTNALTVFAKHKKLIKRHIATHQVNFHPSNGSIVLFPQGNRRILIHPIVGLFKYYEQLNTSRDTVSQ